MNSPMKNPPSEKSSPQEIAILNQAFQSFNEATEQLQNSYDVLNEALEENKNYLHNIMESLPTGVIVVDQNNTINTFNKTAGTITGLDPEVCLNKQLSEVFPTDLFEKIIGRTTKEKQKSPVIEREIETPHHGKIYTRISTSPVLDKKNDRIGTVLNIEDITELRRLGEEAQRNRRLRATGEMAAGIAHEIRNPLGSIELFSSLLKKDLSEDPEKKEIVEHISASVKNMDRIISSLLLFAKSPQPSTQSCDLNTLLKDLFKNSSAILIPDEINPVFSLSDNAIANGDSHLLKQVFINLIRNSIQAMPEGGNLEIATQKCSQFEQSSDQSDYYRQFIKVTVADQGGGISEENLANIFNPFFTTKDHGTGLGLSISHNIIKAHQGTIDVENEVGKGARFILKIPCWDHELDKE
jgi:two-component system sensor histidine kinase FlrB